MKRMLGLIVMLLIALSLFSCTEVGDNTKLHRVEIVQSFDDNQTEISYVLLNQSQGKTIQPALVDVEGYVFKYWVLNGILKKDYEKNHSFLVNEDLTLTALYAPIDKHIVLLVNQENQLLDKKFVSENNEVVFDFNLFSSRPGEIITYPKFINTATQSDHLDITEDSIYLLNTVSCAALTYTLTVDLEPLGTFGCNEVVLLEAEPTKDGLSFSHWEENGIVIDYRPEFKLSILDNRNLERIYLETPLLPEPFIHLALVKGLENNDLIYLSHFDLPDTYEFLDGGFIVSDDATITLSLEHPLVDQVTTQSFNHTTQDFLTRLPKDEHRAVRAYMTYIYQGEEQTLYSDQTIRFDMNSQLYIEKHLVSLYFGDDVLHLFISPNQKMSTHLIPTIEGYQFGGIYEDVDKTIPFDYSLQPIVKDTALYVDYFLNTYSVTFETNGGLPLVPTQTVGYQNHVETPPVLMKEGYYFDGWYADPSFIEDPWSFVEDVVVEPLTLYAKWEPNVPETHTVQFETNGGLPLASNQTVFTGDTISEPIITKADYQLLGWYSHPSFEGNPWNFATDIVEENLILYARWEFVGSELYLPYYDGIQGLTGDTLKNALYNIIRIYSLKSYGDARYILQDTDKDPDRQGYVYLIYDRLSVPATWDGGNTWNREHVVPQSILGVNVNNNSKGVGSDLHNLRPATPSVNSSRGNSPFAARQGSSSFGHVSGGWYPGDDDRGDVARIVFYMNTLWDVTFLSVGSLDVFLQWHLEDPVDDFERARNEVIYNQQGNRNPYIDHPDLAHKVYGHLLLANGTVYRFIITVDPTHIPPSFKNQFLH